MHRALKTPFLLSWGMKLPTGGFRLNHDGQTHTHIHKHTHKHIRTHTHTHTRTHTHTCKHTHIYTHTHTHASLSVDITGCEYMETVELSQRREYCHRAVQDPRFGVTEQMSLCVLAICKHTLMQKSDTTQITYLFAPCIHRNTVTLHKITYLFAPCKITYQLFPEDI